MKFKEIFYAILPEGFKNSVTKRHLLKQNYPYTSFAQAGEDKILEQYFVNKKGPGFYVDIGANHPYIYSNTYKFYLKGWKGINVDANPGTKKLFDPIRPNDITVETGVSKAKGQLEFYMFENSVFNTLDKETAEMHCREFSIQVKNIIPIQTTTLEDILDTYLPASQAIDFMSVDAEGLDMEILQSNNWEKYKPEVIAVECVYEEYGDIQNMETAKYLKQAGYSFFAKTFSTFFFALKKSR